MSSATTNTRNLRPTFVHLLLTMACNLRCPQCFVDAGKKMRGEMGTLDLVRVAKDLVELRPHTVHVEGGEAMLSRDLYMVLTLLSELRDVLLVTNGTYITPEAVEMLKDTGIRKVALSLDGATEATHNIFRPDTFSVIMESIRLLREAGISVRVSTTLMKPNVHEAMQLVERCLEWGVDLLNYDAFDFIGRAVEHPEYRISSDDWQAIESELFPRALEVSDDIQINVAIPDANVKHFEKEIDTPHFDWIWCSSGDTQFEILPDGSLIPCFVMAAVPQHVAGNVKEQSLVDIWHHSPSLNYYRSLPYDRRCPMNYHGHLFFSNKRGSQVV